jgi:hypothetical protein
MSEGVMVAHPDPENPRPDQGRDARGRWRDGIFGNPAGKPTGARHRHVDVARDLD